MVFLEGLLIFSACLWSYLEAAATPAPAAENAGGWDNAFSNDSTLIPLIHFGEKSYYFSINFKGTFLEADQFCRDIHMDLVRVQSAEENDKLYKYAQESTKEDHFWTAGSKLVDKKNWIWMSTGEVLDYTNWGSGLPDYPNTELCLELWLFRNKGLYFDDRTCTDKYAFICEKDKRRSNIDRDENGSQLLPVFQNPNVSPNINLLHIDDKSYYFGTTFLATYLEATQFCQILHMQLVSVTSEAINTGLYKYIRNTGAGDSFWSSGSKAIDGKTWVWLSTGKIVEYTHWLAGQPDSKTEFCIQLVQQRDNGLFWNDLGCDYKLNFICESADGYLLPGTSPVVGTLPGHTTTPHGTDVEPIDQYPDNPSLPISSVDGRKYRVSKIKANQDKATQTCQQYGMKLVSILDKNKNDIVTNLIKKSDHSGSSDVYWSSGKKQSDGKWTWWNLQPLTYTNWASGEPNNAKKNEFCLEIYFNGQWNDDQCNQEKYFICESKNEGSSHCSSQPIVNVYVNNNQCSGSKNATVTESKKVASSNGEEGYNVEINNNIGTCAADTRAQPVNYKKMSIHNKEMHIDHKKMFVGHKKTNIEHKKTNIEHKKTHLDHSKKSIHHKTPIDHKTIAVDHKKMHVNNKKIPVNNKHMPVDDKKSKSDKH